MNRPVGDHSGRFVCPAPSQTSCRSWACAGGSAGGGSASPAVHVMGVGRREERDPGPHGTAETLVLPTGERPERKPLTSRPTARPVRRGARDSRREALGAPWLGWMDGWGELESGPRSPSRRGGASWDTPRSPKRKLSLETGGRRM